MIRISFGKQVANTPTYPTMCQFPVFVAPCYHNPPTLQTERQMDGQMSCSCHKHNMHMTRHAKSSCNSIVVNNYQFLGHPVYLHLKKVAKKL